MRTCARSTQPRAERKDRKADGCTKEKDRPDEDSFAPFNAYHRGPRQIDVPAVPRGQTPAPRVPELWFLQRQRSRRDRLATPVRAAVASRHRELSGSEAMWSSSPVSPGGAGHFASRPANALSRRIGRMARSGSGPPVSCTRLTPARRTDDLHAPCDCVGRCVRRGLCP